MSHLFSFSPPHYYLLTLGTQLRHLLSTELHKVMSGTSEAHMAIATLLSHSPSTNQQHYTTSTMSRKNARELVTPTLHTLLGARVGAAATVTVDPPHCNTCSFHSCDPHLCRCTCHRRTTTPTESASSTTPPVATSTYRCTDTTSINCPEKPLPAFRL